MKKILSLLLIVFFFCSCSDYQKANKSHDFGVKFDEGVKQYEAGNYTKAIKLFEQIVPAYRGKPQGEKLFYMYAQSLYKTNQFVLSGYQFESFVASYPKSEKFQEAFYLGALSYANLSPVYSKDQTDTFKALDKMQTFIDLYPNSEYFSKANEVFKILSGKIQKKVFENAKEYNRISNYKSAIVAFDNFLNEFPGTSYKEDALYYKFDSAYLLAINSVLIKKHDRLNAAKNYYNSLIHFSPNTKYKIKVDQMNAEIEKELQKYKIL